jgi:hypothetical protein
MKLDWQWPAAVVFCVAFAALSGLVYFGKIHPEALTALLAWLIPSPFQATTKAPPSLPVAILLLGLTWPGVLACGNEPRVTTAADLFGYAASLDACREQGKDAGSYAAYETCAQAADRKYGRDGGR